MKKKKVNWDINYNKETIKNNKRNGELLPECIRAFIIGPSSCGKTLLLIDNFIRKKGWMSPTHLYIYSKSLDQPKYKELKEDFEIVEEKTGKSIATFIDNNEDIIPLDDCKENSLIIIDDWVLEKQDIVREISIRGRHKGINLIYLCQTYSKIPKQLIRDNANFLCLFRQDNINLKHVYNEFVGADMSFEEFQKLCKKCWNEDFGFITIDMTRKPNEGKYRNKIKDFINTNIKTNK